MSAESEYMEHRWGTRVELDVPAEILAGEDNSALAVVKNASLSGAFLETSMMLPPLSRVSVALPATKYEALDACVVRVDSNGLALEWLDPGAHLLPALFSMRRNSRGDVLQTAPERVFNAFDSTRT